MHFNWHVSGPRTLGLLELSLPNKRQVVPEAPHQSHAWATNWLRDVTSTPLNALHMQERRAHTTIAWSVPRCIRCQCLETFFAALTIPAHRRRLAMAPSLHGDEEALLSEHPKLTARSLERALSLTRNVSARTPREGRFQSHAGLSRGIRPMTHSPPALPA